MIGIRRGEMNVGAGFNPLSLSPALWLDAYDVSTITLVSNAVSQWADKSGNNRHATQSISGIRPTYTIGESVDFNAQGLVISTFPSISNGTFFAVQNTSDSTYLLLTSNDSLSYSYVGHSGSTIPNYQAGFGTPVYYQNGNAVSWSNRGQVYTALHNATNVVGATGIAMGSAWNSNFRIGYYTTANPEFHFQGTLKELIIFPNALSTVNRQHIEGYLAWKWSTVASLPSNHPYKNASP